MSMQNFIKLSEVMSLVIVSVMDKNTPKYSTVVAIPQTETKDGYAYRS